MIYLDNNATTQVDSRVVNAMLPFFSDKFGNAASKHQFGFEAKESVKNARIQVGNLINCTKDEIIFTSGATEAINIALKGAATALSAKGKHIITIETEHHAVLDTCKYLEANGFRVTYLPVDEDGLANVEEFKSVFKDDTILAIVMFANNETGVIQPIEEMTQIAHSHGALFMTDATQAVGKTFVDVKKLDIDLLAFSGHKFYGPKGIGVLYVKNRGGNRIKLNTIIHGGGHERGIRSGTLNVPGIVGLGEACRIAKKEMKTNQKKIQFLRDKFEKEVLKIQGVKINSKTNKRLFNVSNIQFKNIDADALMLGIPEVMLSTGSACSSAHIEPSHVLIAMGLSKQEAFSSVRFSFGKNNEIEEINYLIPKIIGVISLLSKM